MVVVILENEDYQKDYQKDYQNFLLSKFSLLSVYVSFSGSKPDRRGKKPDRHRLQQSEAGFSYQTSGSPLHNITRILVGDIITTIFFSNSRFQQRNRSSVHLHLHLNSAIMYGKYRNVVKFTTKEENLKALAMGIIRHMQCVLILNLDLRMY